MRTGLLALPLLTHGAPATRKRGFSGMANSNPASGSKAHGTCSDGAALNLSDSWYYHWGDVPYPNNICDGNHPAAEFVPMIIGLGVASKLLEPGPSRNSTLALLRASNARFLLGYNEPDYGNGKNHPHMCSAAEAAAEWPKVQEVAALFDPPLILVSPGISSSGPDAWDKDGASPWLDYFFGNCTDVVAGCDPSLIKYVAFHDYTGDAAKLERRVSGAAKRYQRKVWLTEFAITKYGAPPGRDAQDAFMKQALPYLDASDDVYRYAWFSNRNKPNQQNGGSNLLPSDTNDLEPTSTGLIYAQRGDAPTSRQ